MRVADFHFDLPEQLIAQHPPPVRGSSRMLVAQRNPAPAPLTLTDANFTDLPHYLQPGDLLVLNDSRVLPSRLFATRAGASTQASSPAPSGRIEVLLTEQLPSSPDAPDGLLWRALCRPAKKLPPGETLLFHNPSAPADAPPVLTAEVVAAGDFGERTLRFAPTPDFYALVARIGHMPLPPYIRRDQSRTTPADEAEDNTRYQTVYAQPAEIAPPRSAAAPTAGLHFTPEVLAALRARRVEIASLTLHVGLGTFQPVRVAELQHIRLHSERYTLPPETAAALNRALAEGRRILAVGTTTTRTLEHIAQQSRSVPNTPQQPSSTTADEPLPHFTPHSGETSIFLAPGHRFRAISGLLTNFHLPESTLIMLVAALAANTPQPHAPGVSTRHLTLTDPDLARRHVLAAYTHAIAHRYRFFSYGDCMLLL